MALLDDERSLRALLVRLLVLNGCTPLEASDARQLFELAEARDVEAFVIDLNLEGPESGLDVLAWLRLQPKYVQTPVFILTGAMDLPENQQLLIRRHRAHLFYKGQSLQLLMDFIQRLLIDPNPH